MASNSQKVAAVAYLISDLLIEGVQWSTLLRQAASNPEVPKDVLDQLNIELKEANGIWENA